MAGIVDTEPLKKTFQNQSGTNFSMTEANKVYLLNEGMFWEGAVTTAVYRVEDDARAAAVEVAKKYNEAIEGDDYFEPLPLEPEVSEYRLFWGNGDDFYIEVIGMEVK